MRFRSFLIVCARQRILVAAGVGIITVLLAIVRTGLWKFNLFIPIQYWGDALYFNAIVKAVAEGTWGHHISRLGMPFGMETYDFPAAMHLNIALLKVLRLGTKNPFLLINLFWLLTISMGAAFAYLFFRWVSVTSATSICFGIVYGLIPFGFFRNIGHLNLVYFLVPAGSDLGVSLARGQVFEFFREDGDKGCLVNAASSPLTSASAPRLD